MPKQINIKVTTLDEELEFSFKGKRTGKELFDEVVKNIGVREVWYFGLQYVDNKGLPAWLKMHKKIASQDIKKQDPLVFNFGVKFFPEDVDEELIQDKTKRMFYLQVKKSILDDTLYCPPETATLLASYAFQVKYGDYEEGKEKHLTDENLLPKRVLNQYKLSREEWISRITLCWKEHDDMMKEDAIMEYLKICQDLDMYGVNYFDIKNKKGTELLMGVDALGINVYEKEDKLTPKIGFPWSEIRNISFNDKKFIIKPIDKKAPDFVFFTAHLRTNKRILRLCMGNHELYMRRRKPNSIEVQQMKNQCFEEKAVRDAGHMQKREEKRRNQENEEKLRIQEERQREMEEKLKKYEEEKKLKEEEYERQRIQQEEELEAKNCELERLIEENNQAIEKLQMEKENEAYDGSVQRERVGSVHARSIKVLKEQLEENKRELEDVEEQQRALKDEVDRQYSIEMSVSSHTTQDRSEEYRQTQPEIDQSLQEKLSSLRADLDVHKDEHKASPMDIIHAENTKQGRDKYKTLKQIRQGNTRTRIDEFESM